MSSYLPIFAQYSPEQTDAFWAFYLMLGIGILVAITIFFALPSCFIFKKAGKPAWAPFVPFYNLWVYAQIVGRNPLVVLLFPFALFILALIPIVNMVSSIAGFFYSAILYYELALVFGQSQGLAIANIFFSAFINFYLAFSQNAQYRGPLHGAEHRILMEAPWIDPALGVQAINPYAPQAYSASGQYDPNAVGAYQPQGYNPTGAPMAGQPPVGTQPGMPTQPPVAPETGMPSAPPAQPPAAPDITNPNVTTSASDWGPAPEAFSPPAAPDSAAPPAASDGEGSTSNPFESQ